MIQAPFTPEQVEQLNRHQRCVALHPFTCGSGRRTDAAHLDGEGVLVATVEGWACPYCDYRQAWAHDQMADPVFLQQAELTASVLDRLSQPGAIEKLQERIESEAVVEWKEIEGSES